ncbi:MAG: type II secretion system F family protein [archaeon]|nr:type II secretion system F family protein [archaeon]
MEFKNNKYFEELEKNLKDSDFEENAKQYSGNCLKISIVVFIFAWLGWNLVFDTVFEGIVFSIISGVSATAILLSKPKKQLLKKAKKINKHLPFALMQISIDLNSGLAFDKALERTANSDYGLLSEELKKAIKDVKRNNISVPDALIEVASKNRSNLLKRSVAQLISVYEHGTKKKPGEIIRRIALEMLSRQKSESKEFSGKVVMFSLAFIVLSAIIPALFQAFITVGSSFMEIPFDGFQVLIIVGILFPLLDTLLLFYIKSLTPEFLKG